MVSNSRVCDVYSVDILSCLTISIACMLIVAHLSRTAFFVPFCGYSAHQGHSNELGVDFSHTCGQKRASLLLSINDIRKPISDFKSLRKTSIVLD